MATGWQYQQNTGDYDYFDDAGKRFTVRPFGWQQKDAVTPWNVGGLDMNALMNQGRTAGYFQQPEWAFISPQHAQEQIANNQANQNWFDKTLDVASNIVGNPLTWAGLGLSGLGAIPNLASLFGGNSAAATSVLDAAGAAGGEAFGAAANASGAFGGTAPSWLTSTPWIESFANPDFVKTAIDVVSHTSPGSGQNIEGLVDLFDNVGSEASNLLTSSGSLTPDTVLSGYNPGAAPELTSALDLPTGPDGNGWLDPIMAPPADYVNWDDVARGWEGSVAESAAQNVALKGSPTQMINELKDLYKYASGVSPFLKLFASRQGQQDYENLRNDLNGISGGLTNLIRQTQASGFPHNEFVPLARSTMLDPEARRQRLLNTPGYMESQRMLQDLEMRKAAKRGGLKAGETNQILANMFAKNAMDWSNQDFNQIAKASGMDFDSRNAVANLAGTQAQLQAAILPVLTKLRQQTRGDQWNAYNSVGRTLMDLLFNDSSGGGA